MKHLFSCSGIIVAVFAYASAASADVPQCSGSDLERATSARADGLTHYRASKHTGAGDEDMAAALDSFNQACAAGDDTALELRAYALAGLYKYVDAAQSLDAFLVAHPLASLDDETRARVTAQQAEILSHVATLDVDSTPPGAQISIDHFFLGKTPLHNVRLAPGSYELEASQADNVPQAHKIVLALGQHSETFDFTAPSLVETPNAPSSQPADATPRKNLRPWAIGSAIGAGAFAIVGVAGLVYANGRGNAYNDFRGGPDANGNTIYCSSTDAPSSCADIKSSFTTGRTLATIGFVGAGVLAATSITLFYLDIIGRKSDADRGLQNDQAERRAGVRQSLFLRLSCGPAFGAGASCAGAF